MACRKRTGALLLCVGMILILFVSSAVIAHGAGHECSGEDCPVCRMISAGLNLLRVFGLAVLLPAFAFPVREAFSRREQHVPVLPFPETPVRRKVRLND